MADRFRVRIVKVRRTLVPVFWLLLLAGLAPLAADAQEATPASDFVTPDPESCQIRPRTIENLATFLATPSAGTASPSITSATPQVPTAPDGMPADQDVVEGVTVTVYELYACYNANDFLRVFAFFTDGYMARSFASEDISPEAIGLFATPIPSQAADERISILIQDVQVLVDGRIGANVITHSPLGDGADSPSYYIFVEQDGRYLVDEVILPPVDAAG